MSTVTTEQVNVYKPHPLSITFKVSILIRNEAPLETFILIRTIWLCVHMRKNSMNAILKHIFLAVAGCCSKWSILISYSVLSSDAAFCYSTNKIGWLWNGRNCGEVLYTHSFKTIQIFVWFSIEILNFYLLFLIKMTWFMYSRDVLDPTKILNCLLANESDENEVLHPKTKYTVCNATFNVNSNDSSSDQLIY